MNPKGIAEIAVPFAYLYGIPQDGTENANEFFQMIQTKFPGEGKT